MVQNSASPTALPLLRTASQLFRFQKLALQDVKGNCEHLPHVGAWLEVRMEPQKIDQVNACWTLTHALLHNAFLEGKTDGRPLEFENPTALPSLGTSAK